MQFSNPGKQVNDQSLQHHEDFKKVRILNRKTIHLIGLPVDLIKNINLKQHTFFGQYGKIMQFQQGQQLDIGKFQITSTIPLYVKYSNSIEVSLAILCLNGFKLDNVKIRASYGLTRYCQNFLEQKQCKKRNCQYFHYTASEEESCILSQKKYKTNIKQFKDQDVIQYLITQNFNFQKYFENCQLDTDYNIFPGKYQIYKKYLEFLSRQSQIPEYKYVKPKIFNQEFLYQQNILQEERKINQKGNKQKKQQKRKQQRQDKVCIQYLCQKNQLLQNFQHHLIHYYQDIQDFKISNKKNIIIN